MSDKPRNDLPYVDAMHGIQSGVAAQTGALDSDQTPKHLRVGINSAMINDEGMTRLLIEKGVFTEKEYVEAIRVAANRELDRYEDELSASAGRTVKLR